MIMYLLIFLGLFIVCLFLHLLMNKLCFQEHTLESLQKFLIEFLGKAGDDSFENKIKCIYDFCEPYNAQVVEYGHDKAYSENLSFLEKLMNENPDFEAASRIMVLYNNCASCCGTISKYKVPLFKSFKVDMQLKHMKKKIGTEIDYISSFPLRDFKENVNIVYNMVKKSQ